MTKDKRKATPKHPTGSPSGRQQSHLTHPADPSHGAAKPPAPGRSLAKGAYLMFGHHAVKAAIANPKRRILRIFSSPQRAAEIKAALAASPDRQARHAIDIIDPHELDRRLAPGSAHQGVAAEVMPLDDADLDEACRIDSNLGGHNLVLVLDQVTDPQNVGAIIRSAAAFGARALVTTDRHAPPEGGALAKAASGALEALPWVRVTNLARALDELAELGYWRVGLDGTAAKTVKDIDLGRNIVLVLGSEGTGMRPNTAAHCDGLARLPINQTVESLNVSNAAAVALYVFSRPNLDD